MYIEKINGPADVKRLSAGELETLSEEVRGVLPVSYTHLTLPTKA